MSVLTDRAATAGGVGIEELEGAGEGAARRMAGWSALAFAAGVVVANSAMAGGPLPAADLAEAAAWYAANGGRAMLATVMVALTFPALLVFAGSMVELARGRPGARAWMLVGAFGGVAMVGTFTAVAAGQLGAVLLVGVDEAAFAAAWVIHNGAFAVNMSVLGTAFLGFTLGAHAAGLSPSWHRGMGLVGAALLLVTGFGNALVTAGSPVIFLGFGGFLLWLAWLTVTGVRLLRGA